MILFSVLIANYNNAKFLPVCLDSIKKQTYSNWEIIFIDDCSEDNSIEIIENFSKNSSNLVKVYKNDKNHGCGYTKKRCMEFASGQVCGYLDPDDALVADAIELMVKAHEKNPSASVIGSRRFFCNNKLGVVDIAPSLTPKIKNFKSQLETPFYITHFASFKKTAYDKTVGLDPYMKRAVDQDLYLKLEEQGCVDFIDKPLYYYRNSSNSISLNKNYYKATAWHVYAVIETCKRRGLPFDDYCYLLKQKKNKQERFIDFITHPLTLLKSFIIRKRHINAYKKENKGK